MFRLVYALFSPSLLLLGTHCHSFYCIICDASGIFKIYQADHILKQSAQPLQGCNILKQVSCCLCCNTIWGKENNDSSTSY